MNDNATPVLGSGVDNLDNGLHSPDTVLNAFEGLFTPQEEEQPVEDVTEEVNEEIIENEEVDEETTQEEESEEETEAEASDDDNAEEEFYVVEVGDEKFEVTEQELLSGYQRHRDYTQKTQQLSDERKKLDEEVKQTSEARDKYIAYVDDLIDQEKEVLKQYEELDWDKIRQNSPQDYLLAREEYTQYQAKVQDVIDKRNQAVEGRDKQLDIEHNQKLEQEKERLQTFIPNMTPELQSALNKQVESEGFSDEDKALLANAQVVKLLDKARKYDELQERQKTVTEKKISRKVPKVVKPGSVAEKTLKTSEQKKQFSDSLSRVKQNGIHDRQAAVDVFSQYL